MIANEMTADQIQALQEELGKIHQKPRAQRGEVYMKMMNVLGISPNSIEDFRDLHQKIKEGLRMERGIAACRGRGIHVGDKVQVSGCGPGRLTNFRKDGVMQIRLETGKSIHVSSYGSFRDVAKID